MTWYPATIARLILTTCEEMRIGGGALREARRLCADVEAHTKDRRARSGAWLTVDNALLTTYIHGSRRRCRERDARVFEAIIAARKLAAEHGV